MPLDIFAYNPCHVRRHAPSGYVRYESYKQWLRDEFVFRCVYCLERERWYPDRSDSFSVDHTLARSQDKAGLLTTDYSNLVYACTRCNSAKRQVGLLDPTKSAFCEHLRVSSDGRIIGITPDGNDLIDVLHLNDDPALTTRRRYLRYLALKQRHPEDRDVHDLYLDAFGYPEDLPDLTRANPPANALAENEASCHHARCVRSELGDVY